MSRSMFGDSFSRSPAFPTNYREQPPVPKLLSSGTASCSGVLSSYDALSRHHPSAHTAQCVGYLISPLSALRNSKRRRLLTAVK